MHELYALLCDSFVTWRRNRAFWARLVLENLFGSSECVVPYGRLFLRASRAVTSAFVKMILHSFVTAQFAGTKNLHYVICLFKSIHASTYPSMPSDFLPCFTGNQLIRLSVFTAHDQLNVIAFYGLSISTLFFLPASFLGLPVEIKHVFASVAFRLSRMLV